MSLPNPRHILPRTPATMMLRNNQHRLTPAHSEVDNRTRMVIPTDSPQEFKTRKLNNQARFITVQ